ncbi:MAG: hypothetical protein K2X37_03565, partial [Chitinophagaceae bacterium]|nr:hypothetical protein [Chitinophagaceae bacterium]
KTPPNLFKNSRAEEPIDISIYGSAYCNLYTIFQPLIGGITRPIQQAAIDEVFGENTEFANKFIEFLKYEQNNNNSQNITHIQSIFINTEGNNKYFKILRRKTFQYALARYFFHPNRNDIFQALDSYIKKHCPLKRGLTDELPSNQKDHYRIIREFLSQGKMLSIATYSAEDPDPAWRMKPRWWHMNSFDPYKGIVNNHAYAVVACFTNENRQFILLSNPHRHSYNREYYTYQDSIKDNILSANEPNPLRASSRKKLVFNSSFSDVAFGFDRTVLYAEMTDSECLNQLMTIDNIFPIEISDFTKRFSNLYVADFCRPRTPSPVRSLGYSLPNTNPADIDDLETLSERLNEYRIHRNTENDGLEESIV